ncbi:MAG: hypothetical protein ACYCXF_07195 [Thermoleophilia bacterium]
MTSVFIFALIAMACFWAPLALGQDSATSSHEYGISGTVGAGGGDTASKDSGKSIAKTVPGDTVLRDTVPRDTVPGDTVPRDTVPGDTVAARSGAATTDKTTGNAKAGANSRVVTGADVGTDNATTAVYDVGGDPGDSATADEYFNLHLECNFGIPGVFWANRADYDAGILSINYRLTNSGPGVAKDITVTGATATNGVTIWTDPLPMLGDLGSGDALTFTLKWLVPKGVKTFQTTLTICADCEKKDDGEKETTGDTDKDLDNGNTNPGINPAVNGNTPQVVQTLPAPALIVNISRDSLPQTGFSFTPAFALALMMTLVCLYLAPKALRIRKRHR